MTRFTLPDPQKGFSVPTGLFIGGTWRDAKKTVGVTNPSNGQIITQVADGDEADAIAAVDAAEAARAGWAATPPRQRAEILRQCFEKMVGAADWLAWLISLEMGKGLADSKAEVLYAAEYQRKNSAA